MKARDLMTSRPHFVLPDEPVLRAAELMREFDIGAVPVVDDPDAMTLVGVITDRDLAIRHVAAAHHHDCPVSEHMTTDPLVTVGPREDVDDVMKKMKQFKVRRVMVVDGDGALLGVVAQADLVREEGDEHPRRVEKVLEEISEPVGAPR